MLTLLVATWASSYHLVVYTRHCENIISTDSIDSITFDRPDVMYVHMKDSSIVKFNTIDSVTFSENVSDTLFINYEGKHAFVTNPRADAAIISLNDSNTDILLTITEKYIAPIISVSGKSIDGRLRIDSEVDYTLVLNGLELASTHAPAINSISKQKATIILADGTDNSLSDANEYMLEDSTEIPNGCISFLGALTIKGKGFLSVTGNKKHAIYAKKSITVKDGSLTVPLASSDAIHSGKNVSIEGGELHLVRMKGDGIDLDDNFTMKGGCIDMNLEGEAAKGVKCGKLMVIEGGSITATASGALKNKNGDLAYCSILKCDSSMTVTGGDFNLVNISPGGKCISVSHNLTISGGTFYMETSGDGAEYINVEGDTDYYTSKCIATDDTLCILRGDLRCLSAGVGGKGIVGGNYTQIGLEADTTYQQGPTIVVETTNSSIVDDVEEDERYGCPKAIKASDHLYVYSGDIHATTHGMGGEGIECSNEMYFYGGNLECCCFDDGINVGEKLEVIGGQIYCNSEDNDGIDSNGSIYIRGGIVASVNQKEPNESFDAEQRHFFVSGGIVVGVGSSSVKMDQQEVLYYNTLYNVDPDKPARRGLRLTNGKYVYVMNGDKLLVSIKNDNLARRGFVTVALPEFEENCTYSIYQGDEPISTESELFGRKLFFKGEPINKEHVIDIQPKYNYND